MLAYEKKHYKNNFITKVIFRLDFKPIAALQAERQPDFSERIRDKYPVHESRQTAQVVFSMGSGGTGIQQELKGWVWEHRSENRKRTVVLSQESLTVQYDEKEFTDFRDFLPEVRAVYESFQDLYQPEEIVRVGLRYIDQIVIREGNPHDWNGIVSKPLATAVCAGLGTDMKLRRSMHQLQASYNDINILFNYGIANPDYPNPVARREFVLDTDCYIAEPTRAADVLTRFGELNDVSEFMFETSIEDGLRSIMGIIQ